jgi:hypothetical protein
MTRSVPIWRDINNLDRTKIERALQIASVGRVAILCSDSGSWFVHDMRSPVSRRRVELLVQKRPETLVGFYSLAFGGRAEQLRRDMLEDLTYVGAI